MEKQLYRLDITLNQSDSEIAAALIFEYIQYGWEEENLPEEKVLMRLHCEEKEILEQVRNLIANLYPYALFSDSEIENKDWTEAWKQYFTAVDAGNYIVLPSWEKDNIQTAAKGKIPLLIEPKSAFGTGHHATTALCLHAISDLKNANKLNSEQNFLDLGCGTGILGIACQKIGMKGLCVDIDPIAMVNTEENLQLNNALADIQMDTGSIDIVKEKFDIVIANILAGPLKMLAPDIINSIKTNGYLVLSGILSSQADDVCEAYSSLGKPKKIEAQDIPHLCPENIATNEIKPAETWVALIWEL